MIVPFSSLHLGGHVYKTINSSLSDRPVQWKYARELLWSWFLTRHKGITREAYGRDLSSLISKILWTIQPLLLISMAEYRSLLGEWIATPFTLHCDDPNCWHKLKTVTSHPPYRGKEDPSKRPLRWSKAHRSWIFQFGLIYRLSWSSISVQVGTYSPR